MKFRLVEDFDDLLLEYKAAIEPGSDLEKNLIYDIEHTDIPYDELARKYVLNSTTPIKNLVKSRNLNVSHRPHGSAAVIKPGSELEKSILNEIEHTDKSYTQLGNEYGIAPSTIRSLAYRKNLRAEERADFRNQKEKKLHVYFNTLEADIKQVSMQCIQATLRFTPSIYLGEYSVNAMKNMYYYVKKTYFREKVDDTQLIEFYLKIASKEISLNYLITEMKDQSNSQSRQGTLADYKFITASTEELSTVDFDSVNYPQLAKDVLTFLSRKGSNSNDFDRHYKDLKSAAAQIDPETADSINRANTYIDNNLETVAHNIYSKKGDLIESANYIDGIPYETLFDVTSPQDIATCMKPYKNYLLYGFMDKSGDIVYIGISVNAQTRSFHYANEDREMILQAFKDGFIKKLIIFKSNLPVQSRSVNIQLICALESYFAEVLFKTYPENYPKALNKAKPGQNSSALLASQKLRDFEIYISKKDRLLSLEEFRSAVKEILNLTDSTSRKEHPYHQYAQNYIAKHEGNLSFEDKQTLWKNLVSSKMYILWDICSSESEYRTLVAHAARPNQVVDAWKNYRIKNNLPITEDLDDDIDMEYYV